MSLGPTATVTLFRVCTTDIAQSQGLASQARAVGATRAFVFDDQEPYGQGIAWPGLGTSVVYMGADGIVDSTFISDAGSAASGSYGTTAYQSAFSSTPGPYSANAYDAMNILLTAVEEAINANGGTLPTNTETFRESVRANVGSISYSGAIGHTTFDSNGDTGNKILTLHQVQGGQWTSIKNSSI